ncbi:hypothetical protein [Flagellimonas pacifica]|uniref:Uncharacterized protein n=1 Tax=Flagellimonas pacifica TaxID=1247520 RepID=A0A285MWY4_9FLAO|nr:hypothetical protein [Allomuricauda parva]SNZ01709.1 hypothetical protein SAMN06265377_3551 [Allomuricauda parva]
MNITLQLRETLRFFLLPISFEKEADCIQALEKVLSEASIEKESYPTLLKNKHSDWKETGKPDAAFQHIISTILETANPKYGQLFSDNYFLIHSKLQENPFISFELSSILLSHLRLIAILAENEKMSSAKISNVLTSIDTRLSFISWKEIQQILSKLGLRPEMDLNHSKKQYQIDEELEIENFADADIGVSSFLVSQVAKNLKFPYDAEILLNKFADEEIAHLPYLQILHYQCLISEFYDHVLSVPYEFSPRGNVANWLFGKWDKLVSAGNPVLNNAKAVDVLDKNWARSRKTNEFENASVLVELLHGMDGMGYSASQELASWLRQWLIRYMKLNSVEIQPLPNDYDIDTIIKIISKIASNPTSTYGILEQRLLDVLASIKHSGSNWRPRGLKDSVNTNNTSRKKLGDIDFQDSSAHKIIAYEAHGGKLNKIYLEGHIKTFATSFRRRKEELEAIADIENWDITVVFVAFVFASDLTAEFEIDGLTISLEFKTFKEILSDISTDIDLLKYPFNNLLIDVVNSRRTPNFVREKIKSFLG